MDVRAELWEISSLKRVRQCGRVSVLPGGDVVARGSRRPDSAAVAAFAGLSTCGSVWSCPVHAAKIGRKRQDKLERVVAAARAAGDTVAFATFTLSHDRDDLLRDSWGAASSGWAWVTSGPAWEKICAGLDPAMPTPRGWVKIMECTHGGNGWHPHVHCLIALEGPVSQERARQLGEHMFARWLKGLQKKGYSAIRDQVDGRSLGLDIQVTDAAVDDRLAAYFTKQLSFEMTHSHTKKGRAGGMTAFQILREFLATGDTKYLAWWHEWEQATQGRKQETWSTETKKRNMDLRKIYGIEEDEQTDDEIAAEEIGGGEDLVQLPGETWRAIRRTAWELLDVIELEGLAGAERFLKKRGLAYGVIQLPGVAPP